MNFLAHYYIATRFQTPFTPLPFYVVGTALPDLLPLADAHVRLRPLLVEKAPAISLEEKALSAGVLSHLLADAAFHKTQAFANAQAEAGIALNNAGFQGIRVRGFFVAHILVEMALDAALLKAEPGLGEEFYAAFSAAELLSVTRWAENAVGWSLPELPGVLGRFAEARYLLYYRTEEGVATGLSRLCRRARQDEFEGENHVRLSTVIRQTIDGLADQTDGLLGETAARMTYPPTIPK